MKLWKKNTPAPVVGDPHDFWLVQRLSANPSPRATAVGLDRSYSLDYMSSTEYEIGHQFRSLKAIRAAGYTGIRVHEATRGTLTLPIYFVGSELHFAQATASFDAWFGDGRLAGQEVTYFDKTASEYQERVVAWWAMGANILFALSREEAVRLLAAVDNKPLV